jgi:hypothetical protein
MTARRAMDDHDNDMVARSTDIIEDLIKDGYPKADQLKIVILTLCMLLAKYAESENHLQKGIKTATKHMNKGASAGYKAKKV